MRLIPSQFRAMANKRSPTEPSYFVGGILRPVKAFFGVGGEGVGGGGGVGIGERLREEVGGVWAREVFESVAQRFALSLRNHD
jgi:conserved oligomeric Golgi complex subunit 2